ncbi:hypothetical protein BTT_60730 (plasmid) [Bacillus thuringiensis serovar morrisoni str. 4AA1]|nr:hypothetical protein BTT_60730 [Bacillus thuringiensis serovar morrisoni str. 4AA1]
MNHVIMFSCPGCETIPEIFAGENYFRRFRQISGHHQSGYLIESSRTIRQFQRFGQNHGPGRVKFSVVQPDQYGTVLGKLHGQVGQIGLRAVQIYVSKLPNKFVHFTYKNPVDCLREIFVCR